MGGYGSAKSISERKHTPSILALTAKRERHYMVYGLNNIPLDEILQDARVKEYMRKRERGIKKYYMDYSKDYHSQITSCHAWLICLHYEAIYRLKDKYKLSRPEFIVLMGAYLLARTGNNGFTARKLSSTLLRWEHHKVYRHLNKLSLKGHIQIEKNRYSKINRYYVTIDGKRVIRAFSQHYWQVFDEVRGELGEFPGHTHILQ